MDPITGAPPALTEQSFVGGEQSLQPPAQKRRKEHSQDLNLEDLTALCIITVMKFVRNPSTLKQVSKRMYEFQTLEQLASHPSPLADYRNRDLSIPLLKISLAKLMILFAYKKPEGLFDFTPLVCSPIASPNLSSLREEAYAHFAEFKSTYPAEAAMLCSPSIFSLLAREVDFETLYVNSPQELATLLSRVWEERISTKDNLNIPPENALALSEKIVRMPNLTKLTISSLYPSFAAAYPMINPSFFPPNFVTPPHKEEITTLTFIGQLRSLQILEICGVSSFQLPENLSDLQKLSTVSLTHNHLKNIPHSLLTLPSLQTLDLQDNDFIVPPYELTKLPQGTFVDLRRNPIRTRIPKLFHPMIREDRLRLDAPESEEIRDMSTSTTPLHGRLQKPQDRLF